MVYKLALFGKYKSGEPFIKEVHSAEKTETDEPAKELFLSAKEAGEEIDDCIFERRQVNRLIPYYWMLIRDSANPAEVPSVLEAAIVALYKECGGKE